MKKGLMDSYGVAVIVLALSLCLGSSSEQLNSRECENLGFIGLALCSDCNTLSEYVKDKDYLFDGWYSLTCTSDYLNRLNQYRQRVWTCKITGKSGLTYEEALVLEKHAAEKVQQIPEELVAPALRIIHYTDRLAGMIYRSIQVVVFSNKLNLLMPFGPLAILVQKLTGHLVSGLQGWVFGLSLLGIMPLAERLGYATEQLAFYTGDTVGGLLNATFGNATELIISIYALKSGMTRVVQLSLLGSILSNMLLVLGAATGSSMNLARTLGPAIAAHNYKGMWIYLTAPILGSLCGAGAYTVLKLPDHIRKSDSNTARVIARLYPE
ncbi:Vacuolar cation/proton exchanger 5 [Glycine soja]